MKLSLPLGFRLGLPFLVAACVVVAQPAVAGGYADAANGQAGGGTPKELDLLGSPQGYGDPYAAPNGQKGAALNGGVSPTDRLIAQQNGYVGNPAGGAQLRRAARNGDGKNMNNAQGAAAVLYPTPAGLKPPGANNARVREIYKSPY